MPKINNHYLKLQAGYLFPEIARRVAAFSESNPDGDIIRLGIGDVTEPLSPAIIQAMHAAVDELASSNTFRGYGPEQGYDFLRDAIVEHEYLSRGVHIAAEEVFISDGSKCDSGNILDIFSRDVVVAVTDPVYPVYVDTNVMAGNTGAGGEQGRYEGLLYIPLTAENAFVPAVPDQRVDLIYLCYPNNPTGTVIDRETLQTWVEFARQSEAVILYDAAYERYISDDNIPHSIYEVDGAREVAIEFRSFSKTAGFTGVRCAFTVVPRELTGISASGEKVGIHGLWNRRQSTKFNGTSYVVQRGAAATYTPEGKQQIADVISFYLTNARLLREGLQSAGLTVYGGVHAPYVWLKTPGGQNSWEFFDDLLNKAHLVGTPGSGFGASGEGYFRLSAFNSRENIEGAVDRLRRVVA